MIRAELSTTSVLDEATEVVGWAGPGWAGFVILCSLPLRYLEAIFLDQLIEVGPNALHYGNMLGATANATVLAMLIAFSGRAFYARAARLANARHGAPGKTAWRLAPAALASYILTASASILIGYVTLFTCFGFFGAVVFAGLAIGTAEQNERVTLRGPFRLIFRAAKSIKIPVALALVFFCGLFVALVNIAGGISILTWMLTAVGDFDAPNWQTLFESNRRYYLMLFAGAFAALEPFWIAAHVVFVRKVGSAESGDDLRSWFDELQRAES